jgi:hypothetical protein
MIAHKQQHLPHRHWSNPVAITLSARERGLEPIGNRRKEFAAGKGPARTERAGASKSLGGVRCIAFKLCSVQLNRRPVGDIEPPFCPYVQSRRDGMFIERAANRVSKPCRGGTLPFRNRNFGQLTCRPYGVRQSAAHAFYKQVAPSGAFQCKSVARGRCLGYASPKNRNHTTPVFKT